MKQKLLLLSGALCCAAMSFATTYTITAGLGGGTSFAPSSITTVHIGDTVIWQWATGSHTTTSTSIPAGATPWDHPLNSGSMSFMYLPTVAGTYNYQCTPHAPGMAGSFVVSSAAGLEAVPSVNDLFTFYPNPASSAAHLQFNNTGAPVSVKLFDMSGRIAVANSYTGVQEADLQLGDIPAGIYIIMATQGNEINRQRLVVVH